jgi:DNA-binding beta-propeller fold protein YncE
MIQYVVAKGSSMKTIVGSGAYTYEALETWEKLPDGWVLGEVAAVTVDELDRVYVFHRGEHPLIVFERDGTYIRSWGDGLFDRPHGLHIAPDGTIFCTDAGDHTVRQFTPEGELLLTIGTPGRPAEFQSGDPFNRCTHTAHAPNGDIYVSDGYGNARVHRFSPDGTLITSWGEAGTAPGQFNFPHNILCDAQGRVYVADRENHRVQVFDGDGNYLTQWGNLHRPSAIFFTGGDNPVCYVGEIGPYLTSNRGWPNLGPRVSVVSMDGEILARIDSDVNEPTGPGRMISPHSIAADSRGDIYVGDVCFTAWPSLFPDTEVAANVRGLHKFTRAT